MLYVRSIYALCLGGRVSLLFCSVFISSIVKVYLGPRQTSMMAFFCENN